MTETEKKPSDLEVMASAMSILVSEVSRSLCDEAKVDRVFARRAFFEAAKAMRQSPLALGSQEQKEMIAAVLQKRAASI